MKENEVFIVTEYIFYSLKKKLGIYTGADSDYVFGILYYGQCMESVGRKMLLYEYQQNALHRFAGMFL